MDLSRRRIVLSGGTSGIGRELAKLLAPDNHVIVLARPSSRSRQLAAEIPGIEIMDADLAEPGSVAAAGRELAGGEPLDGLINCAAVQNRPLLAAPDFDPAGLVPEIAVNLTAPCLLTAYLLPGLLRRDRAFIMNVNSGLGLVPKTESAVYCGTKGGLNIFTLALRNQLAGTPVRVQQAFLPLVETPMTAGRDGAMLAARDVARQIISSIRQGTPDTYIGKVRWLRRINRLSPSLARHIMRGT